VPHEKWFEIRLSDAKANQQLEAVAKQFENERHEFEKAYEAKRQKITQRR